MTTPKAAEAAEQPETVEQVEVAEQAETAEQVEVAEKVETSEQADVAEQKVSDLTVSQLRELIREVVLDCIAESYEDFHLDLRINPQFAAELQASIDARAAGEPTIPWEEVAKSSLGCK